ETEQIAYLDNLGMRFRGIFSHTDKDFYANNYKPVNEAIKAWFDSGTGRRKRGKLTDVMTDKAIKRLADNYQVIDTGHSEHYGVINQGQGGSKPLQDALVALPPVSTKAPATQSTGTAQQPTPKQPVLTPQRKSIDRDVQTPSSVQRWTEPDEGSSR